MTEPIGPPLQKALERWGDPQFAARHRAAYVKRPHITVRGRPGGLTAVDCRQNSRFAESKKASALREQDFNQRFSSGELVATGYLDRIPPDGPRVRIESDRFRLARPKWSWSADGVELGGQLYVGVRIYLAEEFARLAPPAGTRESPPRPARRTHLGRLVAEVADSIPEARALKDNTAKLPHGTLKPVIDLLMLDSRISKGQENPAAVEREFRRYRGLK